MEDQLAFCPSCGAPQIRVSRAQEQPPEAQELPEASSPANQPQTDPPLSGGFAPVAGIEWKHFLRTAAPLAAVSGMFTVLVPPLGLFILLPAGLIWALNSYRKRRPSLMGAGQGARMGALMGLLSFGFFAVFFLAAVYLNQAKYREVIVNKIQERAAQTPDLQAQQALQWFATPDGLIVFTAIFLATLLIAFLIIGLASGALAVALGKGRNRLQS
jgi:hypothetical protein